MTHEEELRKLALEFALQNYAALGTEGVLGTAQKYSDFLTGKENTQ